MELKKTPLYSRHIQAKAKMVDFAGWLMPVEYDSVLKEAKATRQTCGIFDASHMGEIRVTGTNALAFLQRILSNDLNRLRENHLQYNLILNKDGGVIDDLMVYRFLNSFLCVVNASNKDNVFRWLASNNQENVEITDESDDTALISLQGPQAAKIIAKVLGEKQAQLAYMTFVTGKYKGREFLISRSGYTGEDGFELYVATKEAEMFWDSLVDNGKELGLQLCGLGSRDILRIEAGYPLYGHELDLKINPYQAALDWAVKLNKDFIAKEALTKLENYGVRERREGLVMIDKALPRQGYKIYSGNTCIGTISSGTYSPNLDKFIAMGFISIEWSNQDNALEVDVRGKRYRAEIVSYPFVETRTKKKFKPKICI